eukprot:COSAG01_NODE_4617_length_4876_cov_14.078082_2_plen_76_part_00
MLHPGVGRSLDLLCRLVGAPAAAAAAAAEPGTTAERAELYVWDSTRAPCAPGVSNLRDPFWLRFTYVAPVLVTKY